MIAESRPPWALTIERLIESPIPMPPRACQTRCAESCRSERKCPTGHSAPERGGGRRSMIPVCISPRR
jgi:hypothetical protein